VAIGGNSNALGGFHLSKVVELVTTPESYPVWYTASPIVIPTNRVVEYKYGVVEGGFCKSFEPGACRSMTATEFETVVEDTLTHFYTTSQGHDSEVDLMNEMHLLTANSGQQDMDNIRALGGRLIIVCYHLPVKVTRTDTGSFKVVWAESLIAQSKDDSIARDTKTSWVGTLSVPGGNANMAEAERADLTQVPTPVCAPVLACVYVYVYTCYAHHPCCCPYPPLPPSLLLAPIDHFTDPCSNEVLPDISGRASSPHVLQCVLQTGHVARVP
jgi:hypothetical protein